MPRYQVLAGGGARCRLFKVYDFTATDDVAAEDFVLTRLTDQPVELWCFSRRVGRFEGRKTP